MWWSRRVALFAIAALVAGCQFTPVYGPGGGGPLLTDAVSVTTKDSSSIAFTLRQELENRFGPSDAARFELSFTLRIRSESVAITAEQDINRFNIIGRANFELSDAGSGAILETGEVDSFTSYSATGTTVATLAAKRDAERRLMVILADKIYETLLVSQTTQAR